MFVTLLFCLLAAAGLLAAIVARVAAPKDAIKGLAWHKEHQFFWGNLLYIQRVVVNGTSTLPAENYEALRSLGYKAFGVSYPGGRIIVVLVEPADLKCLLKKSFHNFEKGPEFRGILEGLLGKGVFNVNGVAWREQRNVSSHLFSRRQLRERMSYVFGVHAKRMASKLREEAEQGRPVEIQDRFFHLTFDTINSVAFNRHVDSQSGNPADCTFQTAFDACQRAIINRFLTPWWRVCKYFQCSKDERIMTAGLEVINKYLEQVVDDYVDVNGQVRPGLTADDQTLIGLYMRQAQEEGKAVDRVVIRDMIMNFVIAGRDTTASALTSCIELLTEDGNESWQDRLCSEADSCFAGHMGEPLTLDDIADRSVAAEAVLLEALRLRPAVPINEKVCVVETRLPSGITLPVGTSVSWCVNATNRIPSIWGADADVFNPTRWITEGDTITTKYDEYSYPTFNAGPRLCLGRNMAILEGKIALLTLFAQFRFSRAGRAPPRPVTSVTWQIARGFEVNVHLRC